jgi:hypothetical protein
VDRSAAAKAFDPEAVRLAVIAHVRHARTDYDDLLNRFADRQFAREHVRGQVEEIARAWEAP